MFFDPSILQDANDKDKKPEEKRAFEVKLGGKAGGGASYYDDAVSQLRAGEHLAVRRAWHAAVTAAVVRNSQDWVTYHEAHANEIKRNGFEGTSLSYYRVKDSALGGVLSVTTA